jgi:hypothetical protein
MSIINRYNNTGFELKFQFHSKFGGNLKEILILKSGNTIIMKHWPLNVHWLAIDHLRNRLNFDLNNIALQSLQFSVILDYKREIDSPKGY